MIKIVGKNVLILLLLFETELPPTDDDPLSVELLTLFPAVAFPCKAQITVANQYANSNI